MRTEFFKQWRWKFEPQNQFRWRDVGETRLKKCNMAIQKFSYFLIVLRSERSSLMEFWQASIGLKSAHPKIFDQKSLKSEGSSILRYGVRSDWKMIFLHAGIENFSGVYYREFLLPRVIFRNTCNIPW